MKDEYDDFDDDEGFQHLGLGAKKRPMTKNEQIYGDFYDAYEEEPKMNFNQNFSRKSAYSNFKSGSTIENYAAECDVHIPEPKPKKKIKTEIIEEEEEEGPVIGQFNLQSFLKEYQQNEELEQIDEEEEEEDFNGPFCLHSKIKNTLNLVKIGEEDDEFDIENGMDLSEMTFEQYQKIAMRNGKKVEEKKKLTPEEREKEKEFIEGYGVGYKMLESMGFNISKGLGKEEKGMTKPVEAVFKTAFTTKDSELREEEEKKEEQETEEEELSAEETLFQYRSKNTKINNFLLDLKNKFESVTSKMFFYEREVQNYDRDDEITNSLKLQKLNQIEEHEDHIKRLTVIKDYGVQKHSKLVNIDHKEELNLKNIYPRLALKYKLDVLFVKNNLIKLKSLKDSELYDSFPETVREMNQYLNHFYLEKERETIKGYQEGIMSFKDRDSKIWNVNEEVIDLIDEGPTEEESVATVSIEDQQKIIRMIELVAEKTVIEKINQVLITYKQINDIKNFKMLECLRSLKELNKTSEIVQNIITTKIKPLVLKYYETFNYEDTLPEVVTKNERKRDQSQTSNGSALPHLVLFPLFEIMDPKEMELGKLLTKLSQKMWNLKSLILYNILRPILQYCSEKERNHFVNFYLAPRLLYQLEEFDLTQPHICKELLSSLKSYKEFLSLEAIKELIDSTVVPEIVMTYKKYEEEGTSEQDLLVWVRRWCKEIGKIAPQHLEEVLRNDFNIKV